MNAPIRVLVAKPGLDGHDRGAKVIAKALRDAGMEVIYTGLHQTPLMIVKSAMDEGVNVLGLSILSGAHLEVLKEITDLLKQEDMLKEMLIVVGGIIPDADHGELLKMGVGAIYTPGSTFNEMIEFINKNVKK